MRRIVIALLLCVVFACTCLAQQPDPNAPASKEDVQRFLDAMHTRDMVHQMMDAMSKPMHQMVHEQCAREKDKLPADCEEHLNRLMDDMFQKMPWDEMIAAMIPTYQKHFTKGDIDALVTFYTSPTGQKLIREMPAITAESMQNVMPMMRKYIDSMNTRMQDEVSEMKKESQPKSTPNQAKPN